MAATRTSSEDTTDRELVITRTFAAPRGLVWEAWTDPRHLAEWWGPNGFTLTTDSMDLRPGGSWRFVMHGPDGTDYRNKVDYLEVAAPGRLVYEHRGEDGEDVRFQVTVTFEEAAGKTTVTMRMVFPTAEELARVNARYGAIEGAHQTFGRLEAFVTVRAAAGKTRVTTGPTELILTRDFGAPRALVWRAWTEPAMLGAWFGPEGFDCPVCEVDLRVGGRLRVVMRSPDGKEYPVNCTFRRIEPPARLVMSVETGEHPPEWHEEIARLRGSAGGEQPADGEFDITLTERDGITTLTLVHRFPSTVERDVHIRMGASRGWSESFEKLEERVARG